MNGASLLLNNHSGFDNSDNSDISTSGPLDNMAARESRDSLPLPSPLSAGLADPALARGSSVLSTGLAPRAGMGDPHQLTSKTSTVITFRIGLPKYIYNKVTMSDLARGTGYTLSMVSKIFSKDRGLSMEAAKEFAKYLKLSVDETIQLVEGWDR